MKLFKKLQQARFDLLQLNIKKTGLNKGMKFEYYELEDFMPHIIAIFNKLGLTSVFEYDEMHAKITLYDHEDGSSAVASMINMSKITTLKGMTEIQALGGYVTYMKRYCYMAMMELTENDAIDRDGSKPATSQVNVELPLSEANKNLIRKLYSSKKLDESLFKGLVAEVFADNNGNRDADTWINDNKLSDIINGLKVKHYDNLIKRLEAL